MSLSFVHVPSISLHFPFVFSFFCSFQFLIVKTADRAERKSSFYHVILIIFISFNFIFTIFDVPFISPSLLLSFSFHFPRIVISFPCLSFHFFFHVLSFFCPFLISLHFSSCHFICLRFLLLYFLLNSFYFSFLLLIVLRYKCSSRFPFISVRFRSLNVKTADKAQR